MKAPVKGPNRKADAMGAGRKEKAKALLNVSTMLANKAKVEGAKPGGGLRQSMKATDIALKSQDAFGKAVGLASELGKIKEEGARMARTQGKPSATSGASRSVAGKVKPNPNKSKATYLKGKK